MARRASSRVSRSRPRWRVRRIGSLHVSVRVDGWYGSGGRRTDDTHPEYRPTCGYVRRSARASPLGSSCLHASGSILSARIRMRSLRSPEPSGSPCARGRTDASIACPVPGSRGGGRPGSPPALSRFTPPATLPPRGVVKTIVARVARVAGTLHPCPRQAWVPQCTTPAIAPDSARQEAPVNIPRTRRRRRTAGARPAVRRSAGGPRRRRLPGRRPPTRRHRRSRWRRRATRPARRRESCRAGG